jgi:hypothetical protein
MNNSSTTTPESLAIAGTFFVDIGLVDHLTQDVGGARGCAGRHSHQRERQQIASPMGDCLLGDQAANQIAAP